MRLFFGKQAADPKASYKLVKDIKFDNKFAKDLAKEYDSMSTITNEVANELKKVCDFDNYVIGIHRTGYSCVDETYLNDVFSNGLFNNGHAMQGIVDEEDYVQLDRTVSTISDFTFLIGTLKSGHNYKNSDGMILVKIPKEYLDENNKNRKPIYFKDNGVPRLLPEYIYGYIPSDRNGNINQIIRNKNYSDIHDYQNDGLLCEGINKTNISK